MPVDFAPDKIDYCPHCTQKICMYPQTETPLRFFALCSLPGRWLSLLFIMPPYLLEYCSGPLCVGLASLDLYFFWTTPEHASLCQLLAGHTGGSTLYINHDLGGPAGSSLASR